MRADRISVPYFFNPRLDAQIPTLSLPAELAERGGGLRVDPSDPIFSVYGRNAWKSRLRAHPDVAERARLRDGHREFCNAGE